MINLCQDSLQRKDFADDFTFGENYLFFNKYIEEDFLTNNPI